jgi:hypothetical protein
MCLDESPLDPSEIEDKGWQIWVRDLGYWRVDMRHIDGPHTRKIQPTYIVKFYKIL